MTATACLLEPVLKQMRIQQVIDQVPVEFIVPMACR